MAFYNGFLALTSLSGPTKLSKINYLPAILWVLLSTFLWSLIYAAAKFADGMIGTFQITFLRYIGAFATVALVAHLNGGLSTYKSDQVFTHFLRALSGSAAAVAITWSSAHMDIADATAFGMLYGVLVVILGALFLQEHVGPRIWLAIILSLAGALLIVLQRGAFQSTLPFWPSIAAFGSALLFAVEGLLIRILGQAEKALSVMLYVCFFGIALMCIPSFLSWQPITIYQLLFCIFLGPVAIIAQYTTIIGYRSAPLSVVGPVDYSWIVFAVLIGAVFFGEEPGLATLVGGILILAGGVSLSQKTTIQPARAR